MRRHSLVLLLLVAVVGMVMTSTPTSWSAIGPGILYRASLSDTEEQADNHSNSSSVTDFGGLVAFASDATNLIGAGNDTNGVRDIFVRNVLGNTTIRVSVGVGGVEANGPSNNPAFAPHGEFVVFESQASNLVPDDTNGVTDIFLYTVSTGTIQRVNKSTEGAQANAESITPHISADGRYIVYVSLASNLVAGDVNASRDIFLHDRINGTTQLVSLPTAGLPDSLADDDSFGPRVTDDGRFVVFGSVASNLVPGDIINCGVPSCSDIFVRDLLTNQTEAVSRSSAPANELGNDNSGAPSISGDGRYVVFESRATNLVANDTSTRYDVFLRDRQTGQTTRVSVSPSTGEEGNDWSRSPEIARASPWIAFITYANNLIAGDTTRGFPDVYRYNFVTNVMERVSVADDGTQPDRGSVEPSISDSGIYISFTATSDRLLPTDTNQKDDIYLRAYEGFPTPTITPTPSSTSDVTHTPTASITPTPTTTPTNTPVPVTNTPTATPSGGPPPPTFTPTPGVSHTPTPTRTPTWTPTPPGPAKLFLPIVSR